MAIAVETTGAVNSDGIAFRFARQKPSDKKRVCLSPYKGIEIFKKCDGK